MGERLGADWAGAERAFILGKMSLKALAQEFGLNYKTLLMRARQEDWAGKRQLAQKNHGALRVEQVREQLLIKMEESIRERDSIEPKDFKALSSALKELGEMEQQLIPKEKEQDKSLTIRLEGEAKGLGG